jgi:hypothetical protein
MACMRIKDDGTCSETKKVCILEKGSLDCLAFVELDPDGPAEEMTPLGIVIERVTQGMEKVNNAIIGNAEMNAKFLQLKADFDVMRNRFNNALALNSSLQAIFKLLEDIARKQGFAVEIKNDGFAELKKFPAKRVAKKRAKR